MSRKPDDEDEDDFEDIDEDEMVEDFDEIDDKPSTMKFHHDARRVLEQLREDKELDRIINGNFYD